MGDQGEGDEGEWHKVKAEGERWKSWKVKGKGKAARVGVKGNGERQNVKVKGEGHQKG